MLAACAEPVHGRLVDAFTGAPVAGVWVANADDETRTDATGAFALSGRGRLSLGGACALDALEAGTIRVLRWRGTRQHVPAGVVAIDGMPATSYVLRDCMPDRPVHVTLADGSTMVVRPPIFE